MGRKLLIGALFFASSVILCAPAQADTKAGVEAWTRGDYPGAVREWQAQAAKGDADAVFNLGQAYKLGKGLPQDLARAETLFGQAAAAGHLQASDNYGLLLFQRGERQKALPYIRAAADRGDPRAQYLLGLAHFNGDLVPKDWVRAYALVSLAQQQGLAQATPALTQMDQYVPMEQRQQAVQMAAELQSQADATRARQLAAVDLGSALPSPAPAAMPVRTVPLRGPGIASTKDAVNAARRTSGTDSPATAGADYTRPASAAPPPKPGAKAPPVPAVTAPPPRLATVVPPLRPAPASSPAPAAAGGSWRIQLGAFGVAANADAMWNRVRSRPELAGHQRVDVRAGAVIKLQAGGFASEAAARSSCTRLVAGGILCVAVRN